MHKGNEVQKMVTKMGLTISELSQKTGKARNTLYGYFGDPNLGRKHIELVGKAIDFDFSKIFGDYSDIDQEEDGEEYAGHSRQTTIMVEMDGNDSNFERMLLKLRAIHETLKRF